MIMKETSRLSAPGYALCSNAAEKTRKTGKESTLKNTVSCVDNPGHFIQATYKTKTYNDDHSGRKGNKCPSECLK
jgi:hypothetical protein